MSMPCPKRIQTPKALLSMGFIVIAIFFAAGTANADSKWSAHNNANTHTPDYSPLDIFFGGYAQDKGARTTFAYQSMGSRGIKFLNDYVSYVEAIPVSQLSRDQQLAYWLNLHNVASKVLHLL